MTGISFRPLKAEEVECRVAQCSDKGCSLLLYKTSRTDMALLDETVGPEKWQKRYESIDGKLFCSIGILCGKEWIWKQDTGTPSNMEAQKGEASDAFKRAGFCWGIGRELYTAPFIWVGDEQLEKLRQNQKSGRWQCYDSFRVAKLETFDGTIVSLQIRNASKGNEVVFDFIDVGPIRKRLWQAILKYAEVSGEDAKDVADGMRKASGYKETPEYLRRKITEFEDACLQ